MLLSNNILLALTTTATALPNALPPTKRSAAPAPAFSWPSWPGFPVGGGGGGGSGSGSGGSSGGGFGGTGSNTANDVSNKAPCKAITVIFARGTSESGNIGSVIGPPLLKSLQAKVGASDVNYQGVPYPANAAGNSQQGGTGGPLMVSLVQQALQQCPSTKIVLSGYSQGGLVVHKAAQSLSATPPAAAVIFGDPQNGQSVANVPAADLKEFCAQGDGVCGTPRTFSITSAHLSYGKNADEAAAFIASVTGVS
ncbi:MAG: hypothetical protein Q9222_000875 [Ikaeria aurantiellina]